MRFLLPLLLAVAPVAAQVGNGPGAATGRHLPPYAERPALGTITGLVADSATGQPLAYATVALYALPFDSLVGGAITDEKGRFALRDVRVGAHRLEAGFLGYGKRAAGPFVVRPGAERVDAGRIALSPEDATLGAVEVRAEREYMAIGIDRKVYTIDKDLAAQGGDAVDALRNIPSLEVDVDGQVSLRGSSGVTVLIDGKPSGLTGADRSAVLAQLPAASIERIEVITNPSAKFNPDGTAGILNVVLKRDRKQGMAVGLQAGLGTREKYTASGNVNYRTPDVNLFANYAWRGERQWSRRAVYRESFVDGSEEVLDQDFYGTRRETSHLGRAGLDWYLDPNTTLSASGTFRTSGREQSGSTTFLYPGAGVSPEGLSLQGENDDDEGWNLDADLRWDRRFRTPERQWTADLRYSRSTDLERELNELDYLLWEGLPDPRADLDRRNVEDGENRIWTVQTDYVHPHVERVDGVPVERWRIETGLQAILREVTTDFSSALRDSLSGAFVDEEGVSNVFRLTENILSGYLNYRRQWADWGLQAGLRVEQALTDPQLLTTGEVFDNDYFSLFPSVYLSRRMPAGQELQLNYSRRINRPNRWALNPFIDKSDPLNVNVGNPDLQPEYVHSAEANYVKRWDRTWTLTASVFFRQTDDVIRSIRSLDSGGVAVRTFDNFAWQRDAGAELILVGSPLEWLRFTASGTAFRAVFDAGNALEGLQNRNVSWNTKANAQVSMPWDLAGQVSFRYRGPGLTAQGTFEGYPSLDLALRKELLDGDLSVSLRVSDVFNQRRFAYTIEDPNFYQEAFYRRESRIGWLNVAWNFGRQEESRRRSGFEGGDGGMGGEGL